MLAAQVARPLQFLRFINLHEYQAKALMEKAGVNIQKFRVGETAEEIEKAAKELSMWHEDEPKRVYCIIML